MGDETVSDRMARMRQRRRDAGLVEVRVWVRPEVAPLVQDVARHVHPDRVPLLRDVVRYGIQVEANRPPPSPRTSTGYLTGSNRIPVRVEFPKKPEQTLREKLRGIGFRFAADECRGGNSVWLGSVQVASLSPMMAAIEAAGGAITRV